MCFATGRALPILGFDEDLVVALVRGEAGFFTASIFPGSGLFALFNTLGLSITYSLVTSYTLISGRFDFGSCAFDGICCIFYIFYYGGEVSFEVFLPSDCIIESAMFEEAFFLTDSCASYILFIHY